MRASARAICNPPSTAEFSENDIFPPTDITEDWFKLIDYDPENVVKISPVRAGSLSRGKTASGVI